ncbi:MAG: zf-HC2 domain-containing protein [Acidobacteria bacterium]|nr:zf-HC2 domain-containing protein [Acidobacteriota bacterium]
MDCLKFQDSLSGYADGELDSRSRAECAAHRLMCRDCRELFDDVRLTVKALNAIAVDDYEKPAGLDSRIIAATTTGEMLSCNEFDRLIERYFDGVLLAPTFHTFQIHFEKCSKCRRLMAGIEDAIEICREIKDDEIEAPPSLQDRILAATVGARNTSPFKISWVRRIKESLIGFSHQAARIMMTAEMAAAMLIFGASSLLVLSRFGSLEGMASHTTKQAEQFMYQGQRAFNTVQFGLIGQVPQSPKPQEASSDALSQPIQVKPSPELKSLTNGEAKPQVESQQRLQHSKK